MFGFLKRIFGGSSSSSSKQESKSSPAIAFLLTQNTTFPLAKYAEPLAKLKPAGKPVTDIQARDEMIMCSVDGMIVALALMPAPVPPSDIQGPAATSWMWPKGTSANSVKAHKGHIIATVMGDSDDPLHSRLILSQLITLVTSDPELLGIYWPEAGMIHHPEIFHDFASSKDAAELLPTNMWVDFRVGSNPDGSSTGFTQGLAALGFMEIEYPKCSMPAADLREWMQNIAMYMLENGPVLLHGQTIGGSADEKIKITHVKSQFGAKDKVIHLEE